MSEMGAIGFEWQRQNVTLRVTGLEWHPDGALAGTINRDATPADLIAALQQDDALRAEVLRAVLPSEMDLTGAILVAIDETQPGDDGNTALVAAKAVRKAMGVAE